MSHRLLCAAGLLWLLASLSGGSATRAQVATAPARDFHADTTLFAHSSDCVACHNNLTAPSGEDVSIGATWRSTMMANAARDPYWLASLRRETIDHPQQAAAIQDECAACHVPTLQRLARASGAAVDVFANAPTAGAAESTLRDLAADGVSCTVCHQIANEKLGTRESYNGGFVIAPPRADGIREIYGPHAVDAGRTRIMHSVTGFAQAQANHLQQSEVCATCHTLITKALGPTGEIIGTLPEQMNYQEWRHSAFSREERSCQSCHMPKVQGPVRISSVLGDLRDSLARHVFVGGNAFMVRMLSRYRAELGVEATSAELEATARATLRQLEQDTATVAIENATIASGALTLDVAVRNLTGHKLPTGYPARRAWLHVTVRSGDRTLFESGAIQPSGAIAGNDHDLDPTRFEPHYASITSADQVQIYESIMGTLRGAPTTGLLEATQYLKDNRLLPRGFDKATADREIGVYGDAAKDVDFASEGDRVRYVIQTGGIGGPLEIDATLRFQPIGFRWAVNLQAYETPEPRRFVRYYQSMSDTSSTWLARATARVGASGPVSR